MRLTRPTRVVLPALAVAILFAASAAAQLQRTVNGPVSVVPGRVYSLYVSGFRPGDQVYPTLQPAPCARTSERCEQEPCPSCASTTIGPAGTATIRFRWPRESIYAVANMDIKQLPWKVGSWVLIRIDLASRRVPSGCERMQSLTANPHAGSIVCAATLTKVR
jgi:hypothetical protein